MEFSTILDDLNEPIVALDSNLRVIYVNKYFYTFAKISPRVFSGAPLISELIETNEFAFKDKAALCLKTKKVIRSDELSITALKSGKTYRGIIKLIPVPIGDEYYLLWTFLDFTNEYDLQNKYRDQMEELRGNHNFLMRGNKHQAIGEVYETISHEINNPLTSSMFSLDKLQQNFEQKKIDQKKCSRLIKDVSFQIRTVSEIVTNLKRYLTFNTSSKEYIDLIDIIERSHELAKTFKIFEGINFTLRSSFDSLFLWGNKTELTQVFVNLFKNSAEAFMECESDDRSIDISIEEDYIEQQCRVIVHDNGPGVDEAMVETIFLPFSSKKHAAEGTGLGLSIVHKIIEDHNGMIDLSSVVESGATFTMTFPSLELSSFVNNELFRRIDDNRPQIVILIKNEKILNLLNLTLRDEDYLVVLTNTIHCKQEVYTDFVPDLLVTDMLDQSLPDVPVLCVKEEEDVDHIIKEIKKKL